MIKKSALKALKEYEFINTAGETKPTDDFIRRVKDLDEADLNTVMTKTLGFGFQAITHQWVIVNDIGILRKKAANG